MIEKFEPRILTRVEKVDIVNYIKRLGVKVTSTKGFFQDIFFIQEIDKMEKILTISYLAENVYSVSGLVYSKKDNQYWRVLHLYFYSIDDLFSFFKLKIRPNRITTDFFSPFL